MFSNHFQIFLADTPESKQIHYSIRYQVFCEEMGFENKEEFPSEQEYDQYDDQSVHFIVRHIQTGQWIGAVRLIIRNDQLKLPIEQYLKEPIISDPEIRLAEISRLCLVKEMRRRASDMEVPYNVEETDVVEQVFNYRRNKQGVIWGMLNAGFVYCHEQNIHTCYFMITEALAKYLNRNGFYTTSLGDSFYHRGNRMSFKKDIFGAIYTESWRNDFLDVEAYQKYSEIQ